MLLTIVRWVLLVNGIFALLGATILYRPARALLVDPYLRLGARIARVGPRAELPIFLREPTVRAWWAFMGILMIAASWYVGTSAGAAMVLGHRAAL